MSTRRIALAVIAAAALLSPSGCKERAGDEDEKAAAAGESKSAAAAAGVTLSAEALSRSSVKLAVLESATHVPVRQAFGQVVDAAPLFQAAATAAARRAELDSAQASLAATGAELTRVRGLFEKGENASRRSLEAAEAAQRGDQVRVVAARTQLAAGWSELGQSWGPVITGWVEQGAPELQALADGRERLLLVTLPGGAGLGDAPAEAVVSAGGSRLPARLVSPSPRTDPALQGPSLFYRVAGGGGILWAGLNLAVELPDGAPRAGVLVPDGAVVRWSGVRWAYRQSSPGHFERVSLEDAQPVGGGLFVTSGLAAGDQIVIAGAAVLLSQELTNLGLAAPGGEG
jgi:hypothetical protein